MLPFRNDKRVGLIVPSIKGGKTANIKAEKIMGEDNSEIQTAAEDLLRAIENKSASDLASALKAAFDILESQPHEEYEDD